ncbi:Excinuclease ABC subunit C [Caloramator quimbayensis]|uniref:UvrABC system protein C n=1 Tax=Caloramator quimbayensis TaxID=1147123 RepID=A0A1T4YB32_9CLOT|nr:excinuclease ABC subunit UvrC [Caloramator quimbayensis]SKA98475.1 Excinuclease ABC subunit C [Caloramator quimbayensis]
MFDLDEALKNLPDKPGVYIMKNSDGEIIYIGKAVSLKNRVRQYFQNSKNHSPKVYAMVSHIEEFEYILTDTEIEALILECNLIKKHKPRYNILLKDDKHYPYIKVTVNEEYPRIFMTRKIEKDGAKYFGPYTDTYAVRETLQIIKKLYPIRSCKKTLYYGEKNGRPCLNYHIKRCLAPCTGTVNAKEYENMINNILLFLSGKHDKLIEELTEKMNEASENLQFERAAELRDKINSIKTIQEKQKIITSSNDDEDVIAYAENEDKICIEVFFIRGGKLLGREDFYFDDIDDDERLLSQFIMQFYSEREYIPKNILLQRNISELGIIESYLTQKRGSRVYIKVPERGVKSGIIELARKNAVAALEQLKYKILREKNMTEYSLEELSEILELDNIPNRIEAYDISNIQGTDSVGCMVVFEGGKPKNSDYRRFKIKTVEGPDDYRSMEEILIRRFKRGLEEIRELENLGKNISEGKFSNFPDLIMMDGGLGQVSVAEKVLEEFNLDIPVCGMVKDEKHKTKGIVFRGSEISLYKDSNSFKLITRIQDEVHRFAISYHRSLRTKNTITSILDEIPEIGKKRRLALIKHFENVEAIKKASIEELRKIEGMNEKAAIAVYEYFNKNDRD